MAELDRFQDFRSGVAAPSEDARRRAAARLQGAIEGKHRHGRGTMLLLRRRPGRTVLGLAALATAVGTALFVSAPWKTPPGFLDRAQAALTPPAGTILHMKWESGLYSIDPACAITRHPGAELPEPLPGAVESLPGAVEAPAAPAPAAPAAAAPPPAAPAPSAPPAERVSYFWIARGPHEAWIDQTPPHRFRMVKAWPNGSGECGPEGVTRREMGGDLDSGMELYFVRPDTLAIWPLGTGGRPPDPVTELRKAISAGRAHLEGSTHLDGRTVERIRIDSRSECFDPDADCPSYAYVDPETFNLVRTERHGIIDRYLTFEYLPRTAANVALANIETQHPDATP
jgi:hypothetical protein